MAVTREQLDQFAEKFRNPIIKCVIKKNIEYYTEVIQNINGDISKDILFRTIIDDHKSLMLIKNEVVENINIGDKEPWNNAFRDLILDILRSWNDQTN